ncbi:TIR domain containing protein [Nitzschia inconspicua]|uniref:TIR domain containing protein n=1 Tax=Nitzschia inconspicua TaxID=303405 RepID=A0A9K3LYM4_9STRA|nr:TIR domain containing protein [Nitzschia inconspicua]
MSTIALKGTLKYEEDIKKWTWKGSWAFGSSLEEATKPAPTPTASSSRFLPPPTSQPFHYTWKEAVDPLQVPVPSLNVVVIGGDDDEEEEDDEMEQAQDTTTTRTNPTKRKTAPSTSASPATATENTSNEKDDNLISGDATKAMQATVPTGAAGEQLPPGTQSNGISQVPESKQQNAADNNKVSNISTSVAETSVIVEKEMKAQEGQDVVKMESFEIGATKNAVSSHEKRSPTQGDKETTTASTSKILSTTGPATDAKKEPESQSTSAEASKPHDTSGSSTTDPPTKVETGAQSTHSKTAPKEKPPPVTFASVMEGFTDAAIKYNNKHCPRSGKWEGHFENVTGRNREKFQKIETQQVDETFDLFLNATPGEGASFTFEDASAEHIPSIPEASQLKLVQVRGCGDNQFGTFEIFGYLDLRSMVMEIQRQYVVTERRASPRRRSNSSVRASRSYSTRKRQPSWKRKHYDSEEETYGRRKRPKTTTPTSKDLKQPKQQQNSDQGPLTVEMVMSTMANLGTGQTAAAAIPKSVTTAKSSATRTSTVTGDIKVATTLPPPSLKITLPTNSVQAPKSRRSSGGGGGGSRKRSASKSGSGGSVSSAGSNSGAPYIRLPAAGDPKKARWRAAHFLYYHRAEPEPQQPQQQQPSDGSASKPNSPKVAPKPKYVIYEGELADNKREGRGICLYSNGTLYEGEWKRNKEHGYGKLMTSDRRRTIYEGEWERGKIQGNGTYYYGSSDPAKPGPRYIGEFKENLRNGMGRYFLPDGSVYDGQFRDGVMNGRGLFTWSDGSMYDGEWKDGKRNGQGLVKAKDGFVYDGQWVNNAMEGRGLAIYPNGQKYEGMFSNGRREGRGTIHFTNGAVYEGRFRDDAIDGQGTMKMTKLTVVPRSKKPETSAENESKTDHEKNQFDFMIPISFQSDLATIHNKAGFTAHGE